MKKIIDYLFYRYYMVCLKIRSSLVLEPPVYWQKLL